MPITPDEARKVARLAHIAVPEDELPQLARSLSEVVQLMEQLNEVDVSDVEPMTGFVPMRLKRRADTVTCGDIADQILQNAPDAREGFFAVPKVVE